MADTERWTKEEVKRVIDGVLHDLALARGLPIHEWSVSDWEWIARLFLTMWIEEWDKHEQTVDFVRAMAKMLERSALNDNRVKGRRDQVDKRAFQEAVTMNMEL